MTEPVRPLEALLREACGILKVLDRHGERPYLDEFFAKVDAALLQAAAPPAPTAELHRYTITSEGSSLGYFRLVEDKEGAWVTWAEVEALLKASTPAAPPERVSDDRAQLRQQLNDVDEAFGFGYFPSDGTGRVGMILEYKRDCVAAQPERVSEGKEEWPSNELLMMRAQQICERLDHNHNGIDVQFVFHQLQMVRMYAARPAVEPREEPTT